MKGRVQQCGTRFQVGDASVLRREFWGQSGTRGGLTIMNAMMIPIGIPNGLLRETVLFVTGRVLVKRVSSLRPPSKFRIIHLVVFGKFQKLNDRLKVLSWIGIVPITSPRLKKPSLFLKPSLESITRGQKVGVENRGPPLLVMIAAPFGVGKPVLLILIIRKRRFILPRVKRLLTPPLLLVVLMQRRDWRTGNGFGLEAFAGATVT